MQILVRQNNIATNLRTLNKITASIDKDDLYKALSDCNKEIGKYNQYIYFIGTSCDNIKLRNKIRKLNDKLFKNLIYQKEFIKKCVSEGTSSKDGKIKLERLICFTLAALTHLENMLTRLSFLMKHFPVLDNGTDLVVNLGFDESTLNVQDEFTQAYLQEDSMVMSTVSNNDERIKANMQNELYFNDLTIKIAYLQSVRDEIEQMDAYQVRFNLNTESQEFFKNVKSCETNVVGGGGGGGSGVELFLRPKYCLKKKIFCALSATLVTILFCVVVILIILFSFK